jgi:hypothetical protein
VLGGDGGQPCGLLGRRRTGGPGQDRRVGRSRHLLDEQERLLEVAEDIARSLPRRERWLLVNHRLSRRIIEAHREWLDGVEAELDDGG